MLSPQIGRLLEAVDSSTVVVVVGDHGWSLGHHGEWAKFSNYEETVSCSCSCPSHVC